MNPPRVTLERGQREIEADFMLQMQSVAPPVLAGEHDAVFDDLIRRLSNHPLEREHHRLGNDGGPRHQKDA
jgi:hypothetical protein